MPEELKYAAALLQDALPYTLFWLSVITKIGYFCVECGGGRVAEMGRCQLANQKASVPGEMVAELKHLTEVGGGIGLM